MLKIRISGHQAFSFLIAALTLVDCCLQIKNVKEDHKVQILTLQSLRIIVALIYLSIGIVFSSIPVVNILMTAVFTVVSTILALFLCTIYQFHDDVFSLLLHLLSVCIGSFTLLHQIFEYFDIDNISESKERRRNQTTFVRFLMLLKMNMMALSTLSTVAIAIVFGVIIRSTDPDWTERQLMYISFIGELFLRMLKCLILPLIFSSLVFAIGNIDAKLSGRIALRAVSYYFATTFIAIIIGIILVVIIQPGRQGRVEGVEIIESEVAKKTITTADSILDLFRFVQWTKCI